MSKDESDAERKQEKKGVDRSSADVHWVLDFTEEANKKHISDKPTR